MQKNVSSQKAIFYAFDSTTNLPKTGDAANITAYVSKDYGSVTVLGDTSATEMDSTNAKGYYLFDVTNTETDAHTLMFSAKSSTANIVVLGMPATVFTVPANFQLESIDGSGRVDVAKIAGTSQTGRDIGASVLIAAGTGTGQLDFTSGVVKSNPVQWNGTAVGTPDTAGYPKVTIKSGTGTGEISTSSGIASADVKKLNGVSASAVNLERSASVIFAGAVTGATTTTTLIDSTLTQSANDHWKGRIVIFTSGTLAYQASDITAFDAATHKITFTAMTAAATGGDTYVIV